MTKNTIKSPFLVAVIIGCSLTFILYAFSFTSLYKRINYSANDFKIKQCAKKELAGSDIILVAIDELSMKKFSKSYNYNWPWPRQFYGIILDYFKKAGADVVIFDILFSESEIGRIDIDGTTSEKSFADAISNYRDVILGEALSEEHDNDAEALLNHEIVFENAEKMPLKQYNSISPPIKKFRDVAGGSGVVTYHADEDGVCRRLPLIFKVKDKYYPQLSFAAYLLSTHDSVVRYDEKHKTLVTRKTSFQLDENGYYPIYWYGPGSTGEKGIYRCDSFYDVFRSAIQIMEGKEPVIPLSDYKDKKIIIYATASGLMDLKVTPFSSTNQPYPGGEIHVTLLDNLLNGISIEEVPEHILILCYLIFSIFLCYTFITKRLAFSLSIAFITSGLTILASFYFFNKYIIEMIYLFPILLILFSSAAAAMYKTLTEGLAKKQIKNIFSRYLHEDVINLLMENPDQVDLKGTEIHGTVLFTDLQGFTTFAEDKTPQELIDVLNNYFQVITNIVLDQNGMLDKYTGDGIMAIFGAPIEREDHARAACEVILAFRDENVNQLISSHKGNILTRIGISSGPIVVGNLGSDRRMDFTAIGDTVNLSARLEGVNKAYGTTNIMSEYTWEAVKDDYFFRELDFIRVKGKNRPIRVFTIVARPEEMTEEMLAIETAFETAIKIFRERKWEDSRNAFEDVLKLNPDDSPAKAYIDRCNLLKTSPELIDSQGVFTFKTK